MGDVKYQDYRSGIENVYRSAFTIIHYHQEIHQEIGEALVFPIIELGETYNPDFLPDHCGNYFQHPKAYLIQQALTKI